MASRAEYDELRNYVRQRVRVDWRSPGLLLTEITSEAAVEAFDWGIPPRKVNWDWERLANKTYGPSLDLAIWHEQTLCGLAYGRAEMISGKDEAAWLELGYIETRPTAHALGGKIMRIALDVLETTAATLNVPETRISNPFMDMRGRYATHGYSELVMVGTTTYLRKLRGDQ